MGCRRSMQPRHVLVRRHDLQLGRAAGGSRRARSILAFDTGVRWLFSGRLRCCLCDNERSAHSSLGGEECCIVGHHVDELGTDHGRFLDQECWWAVRYGWYYHGTWCRVSYVPDIQYHGNAWPLSSKFVAAASWSVLRVPNLPVDLGIYVIKVVSVTPAQYFSKKRGLANGIVYAGGGLGGAVISLAMSAIVSRLGTAWTFRVIGFVMLGTGLPAAWFIQERAPIRTATFIDWCVHTHKRALCLCSHS
jgi:hypothetical protein